MSKKTRPRRGAADRKAAPDAAAGSGGPAGAVKQVMSRLLSTVAVGDPLRAELDVATILGTPRAEGTPDREDGEVMVADALVDEAVGTSTPESAALLRVLTSLGSPAVKKQASRGLAELTRAGVYPPGWVTEIGKAVPARAWRRYDVFGDGETIVVTFRYGDTEHGIVVGVDLTLIPVATLAWVTMDPAGLTETLNSRDKPSWRGEWIGLAEARRRVQEPLARLDRDSDPGVDAGTLMQLPIVRSRVRRLPADDAAQQVPVFTAADRAAVVDEFMNSPLAADAVAAGEDSTRFWAEVLTGYAGRLPGEPPGQVGPRKLSQILLGHVPNTFALTPAQRGHLGVAVTAWARWSASYRGLDEAETARLTERLPGVFARFDEAYGGRDATMVRGYIADLATSDVDVSWLVDRLTRRAFGVPLPEPGGGPDPDVSDPAIRRALTEAEFGECTTPGGMTRADFLAAVQRVVEELWRGDPETTWQAAGRMLADGASRHEVIHALV